jgi:hypothetical protein
MIQPHAVLAAAREGISCGWDLLGADYLAELTPTHRN